MIKLHSYVDNSVRRVSEQAAAPFCILVTDVVLFLFCLVQPYERMNVADALVSKQFSDGDQIIKQVSHVGLTLKV